MKVWVNAEENPPSKSGWYTVKMEDRSVLQMPFARTNSGRMVWVSPLKPLLWLRNSKQSKPNK